VVVTNCVSKYKKKGEHPFSHAVSYPRVPGKIEV
jgi:hypothetical protein